MQNLSHDTMLDIMIWSQASKAKSVNFKPKTMLYIPKIKKTTSLLTSKAIQIT